MNITKDTIKNKMVFESNFMATSDPRKEILQQLLALENDVTIVLDRMYGEELLKGSLVKRLYAINGFSAMQKNKLPAAKTILSMVESEEVFLTIPHIKGFSAMLGSNKIFSYAKALKDTGYERLNTFLELE